ncbi:hypothetical protein AM1BK_46340 [Neobacillus kokaensis]|uniref:Uncharacterized protein n=1 Tax=Neobacillus kokaensis TaxID=2759023 RepID=A0ABQ3NB05_9BACI|nr:hypothetical protein AM1BK_46340 [Neobacillus kokaensis]
MRWQGLSWILLHGISGGTKNRIKQGDRYINKNLRMHKKEKRRIPDLSEWQFLCPGNRHSSSLNDRQSIVLQRARANFK